ncbi:Putative poly(A) RNA polymerase Cid13 [Trichuris trichiura]|uniref:Putative poly(A) RNA polymerase Cid13 n=1 Tax=Trichuris trichiura TaxID=36087 RepID=A0A077ZL52_TRITR|nr:Putative poly(A) RNA polymerase Cid13 [Trichuris trichiura]
MSEGSSVIDLTSETSQEVIDLTEDDFDKAKSRLPPWILHSPYLCRQYPISAEQSSAGFTNFSRQDRLAMEIIAFYYQSVQPRHKLIEKLRVVHYLETYMWRHPSIKANICVVGSSVNGLGSQNCDIDLCLVDNSEMPDEVGDRDTALNTLRKVQRFLQKPASPVFKVKLIPARVPIIRCKFRLPWNYSVDINWNNVHGICNTHLLHHYSQVSSLKLTGICDSVNGYLSSYSWALLLIHFLQCGTQPPVLPCLQLMYPDRFSYTRRLKNLTFFKKLPSDAKSSNQQNVGELLANFFYYYGGFDFGRYTISVRLGSLLPRIEFSTPISIEEPYDCMNTARSLSHEIRFLVFRDYIRKAYFNLQSRQSLSSMYYFPSQTDENIS